MSLRFHLSLKFLKNHLRPMYLQSHLSLKNPKYRLNPLFRLNP
jgi:hypothetical protein